MVGRKPALFMALICNGIFGSLCGLSQTFNFLLAMRFLSGFRYLNKTLVFNVYLKKRFFVFQDRRITVIPPLHNCYLLIGYVDVDRDGFSDGFRLADVTVMFVRRLCNGAFTKTKLS